MKIAIYQIDVERDSAHVAFRDLNCITSAYNGRIPTELYDCIFSGEVAAKNLEDVFYIFNICGSMIQRASVQMTLSGNMQNWCCSMHVDSSSSCSEQPARMMPAFF